MRPGTVLDRRTLNRTLLARQHLLERVRRPAADVIDHLVGMQAQVPRDPYISLWSRLRDFDAAELEGLVIAREAVRMTVMRTTLHLLTARDAPHIRAVTQVVCERGFRSSPFARNIAGVDLDELVPVAADLLECQPLSTAELARRLAARWPEHDPTSLAYAARYLLPVVQVPPRGLLRRSAAPRVTTLRSWLDLGADWQPAPEPPDEMILRYLRAFGPATVADIRAWSWLTELRPVIERLRPRLSAFRNEAGRELLDVDDGVIESSDVLAPVRFLGEYDNVFLAHAERTRITGDNRWGAAYARQCSFFVDGFLAGAWRVRQEGERATLTIEPVAALSGPNRDAVIAEAEGLLAFLAPESAGSVVVA